MKNPLFVLLALCAFVSSGLAQDPAPSDTDAIKARLDMLDTAAREQELRERLNRLEVERKAAEAELARQKLAAAEAERLRAVAAQAAAKDRELAAAEEARRVANRIGEVLTNDEEKPELSVSIGVSVYRGDGERIEKLLSEADRDLYAEKARRGKRQATTPNPRRGSPIF